MKKFLLVLLIVLFAIGILAACAPVQQETVEEYIGTLPGWVIIVGALVLFLIGFGLIWKLIPGFIKVIAIVALAVILAGAAYGLWESPLAEKLNRGAEELRDGILNHDSDITQTLDEEE